MLYEVNHPAVVDPKSDIFGFPQVINVVPMAPTCLMISGCPEDADHALTVGHSVSAHALRMACIEADGRRCRHPNPRRRTDSHWKGRVLDGFFLIGMPCESFLGHALHAQRTGQSETNSGPSCAAPVASLQPSLARRPDGLGSSENDPKNHKSQVTDRTRWAGRAVSRKWGLVRMSSDACTG